MLDEVVDIVFRHAYHCNISQTQCHIYETSWAYVESSIPHVVLLNTVSFACSYSCSNTCLSATLFFKHDAEIMCLYCDIFVFTLNISRCLCGHEGVGIRFSDNDSTAASGHQVRCIPWVRMGTFNRQRDRLFMWIKILCIEYILLGIPTIESIFDVANMVKTAIVKDVPINNDALLNMQAC